LNKNKHADLVVKLGNLNKGGILGILAETPEDREMKVKIAERKEADVNIVKVLIDNVSLTLKIMLPCSLCEIFTIMCPLEYRTLDRVQKPSNPKKMVMFFFAEVSVTLRAEK
jgi:hypothetical protein